MANEVIGVGCDHAGLELKRSLTAELERRGLQLRDFGTNSSDSCDYPDFAHALSTAIERAEITRGLLVCGTGIGMSMAANRHAGVRAVVCSDSFSARMAREHNDANVLCIGARVVGLGVALDLLDAFLSTAFAGGRHTPRVAKLDLK
jgi:ribose 5-phosphate isomerase B